MTDSPRRVAVTLIAELSALTVAIARELKETKGCELFLYVPGAESIRKYRPLVKSGLFVDVIDSASVFEREIQRNDLDQKLVFATAREMEKVLGCTYNEIIMCRNDIGIAFSLGGFGHPRSPRSQETNYVQVLNGLNSLHQFWRSEFESKKIDLIINGKKEIAVVARAMGIPQRILTGARYKNYYYWAEDEFFRFPALQQEFDKSYDAGLPPAVLDEPYLTDIKLRAHVLDHNSIARLCKNILGHVMRRLYLNYKGFRTPNHYYLTGYVKYLWQRERDLRQVQAPFAQPLSALSGRRFVFYPLHTEPEISLQGLSPEYFCQLAAISSIARDLPAGVLLAVKETIHGVGRRPRDFYAQIREFKNIVFLDARELGLNVVKAADAVVTITGTAGLEAAIIGKPVITFGRHTSYDFVPHVELVQREEDLRPALARALDHRRDTAGARVDGANLLRALRAISFDLYAYNPLKPNDVEERAVKNAADGLLRSLGKGTVSKEGSLGAEPASTARA